MSKSARFASALTQSCTIGRRPESAAANLDVKLGEFADVVTGVPCLIGQVTVSEDFAASMPRENHSWRVMMLPGVDLQHLDRVTDEATGELWSVIGPPETVNHRGELHHIEAMIERVEVTS